MQTQRQERQKSSTMDKSMSDILTPDVVIEPVFTRLPSWGDPILPDVESFSEDEHNDRIPLPTELSPSSKTMDPLEEDDSQLIFHSYPGSSTSSLVNE